MAVLTFTKSAYRLGETVTGVVELNERTSRARVLKVRLPYRLCFNKIIDQSYPKAFCDPGISRNIALDNISNFECPTPPPYTRRVSFFIHAQYPPDHVLVGHSLRRQPRIPDPRRYQSHSDLGSPHTHTHAWRVGMESSIMSPRWCCVGKHVCRCPRCQVQEPGERWTER